MSLEITVVEVRRTHSAEDRSSLRFNTFTILNTLALLLSNNVETDSSPKQKPQDRLPSTRLHPLRIQCYTSKRPKRTTPL
ncbi:hypothetical protein HZ326_2386 [Fusarium oxysporum f. sp. albedinis]|nr:hypothetical protein HZ326_2386 [Fusarium oxysporum f. sp. albedinis]